MNKNIKIIAILALFPFNLAMSSDGQQDQDSRFNSAPSETVMLPMLPITAVDMLNDSGGRTWKNFLWHYDPARNSLQIADELIKREINSESPIDDIRLEFRNHVIFSLYEYYNETPCLHLRNLQSLLLTFDVKYDKYIRPLIIAYEITQVANASTELSTNSGKRTWKNFLWHYDPARNSLQIADELIKREINSESPIDDIRLEFRNHVIFSLYEYYNETPCLHLRNLQSLLLTFDVKYDKYIRPLIIAFEITQAANTLTELSTNNVK
ncbi:MAG: hypothetical protein V4544_06180 [Pseudomonadota bacterium]